MNICQLLVKVLTHVLLILNKSPCVLFPRSKDLFFLISGYNGFPYSQFMLVTFQKCTL